MKNLVLALLAVCGACSTDPTIVAGLVPAPPAPVATTPPPVDPLEARPNGSSRYHAYRIVHGHDAVAVSAEINKLLDKGFFFRGELRVQRTDSGRIEYVQAMSKE